MKRRLQLVFDEVERVTSPLAASGEWPCKRGCDECCRRLSEAPRITEIEWETARAAIELLPEPVRAVVSARMDALRDDPTSTPVICPLLNREEGACNIYDARPVACRSYGFYLARDGGRWCQRIEDLNQAGALDEVMLGNHSALEGRITRELGTTQSIAEWWKDRPPSALGATLR